MHSKKVALALVMGMMITTAWAETVPATTSVSVEDKTSAQPDTKAEPQAEVRVEDIDAPILE